MKELIKQIIEVLKHDLELSLMGFKVYSRNFGSIRRTNAVADEISADVFSLGFSQTSGAGELAPYYYLGVVLRSWRAFREASNEGPSDGVDAAAERIVALLHRSRLAGFSVLFSKALRVYEKHTIELATRSITLDVKDGEAVEGVFFYATPHAASSDAGQGQEDPGAEPGEGETISYSEETTGESTPQVIYVRGDAIWD